MNEHRDPKTGAGVPHRIELRVIDLQARAVRLFDGKTEALGDFANTDRPGFHVGFELGDSLLRPAGPDVSEVDSGEDSDAVLGFWIRIHGGHRAHNAIARHVVGGDHHADVQRVELRDQPGDRLWRVEQSLRMPVIIDRRVLGALHHVHRGDEGRVRTVVHDARRGELRCHATARANLRHSWWAALTGGNRHAASRALPAAARGCPLSSTRRVLGEHDSRREYAGDEQQQRATSQRATHGNS